MPYLDCENDVSDLWSLKVVGSILVLEKAIQKCVNDQIECVEIFMSRAREFLKNRETLLN